jgi:asparagine synthase (glutamine-hydrolysing)
MCGLLFSFSAEGHNTQKMLSGLNQMSWRGPDAQNYYELTDGRAFIGHQRLSIIDPLSRSNQPMQSNCKRFHIAFNGEIYNHLSLRKELNLHCRTLSDTETILEGYALIGEKIIPKLDGMFSFVIYDEVTNTWMCARDGFGIKPLFISQLGQSTIICSEASVIATLINAKHDHDAITEWKIARRPTPGASFFDGVQEVLPGTTIHSNGTVTRYFTLTPSSEVYSQKKFEHLLKNSVHKHELSDVDNVGLLSGGLDSAMIAALSTSNNFYTVGLVNNNEFAGAEETSTHLSKNLIKIAVTEQELIDNWRYLTRLRGEPLNVPNEGLIYHVCSKMKDKEKVVLTGEGADELLFGYDGIYRWASSEKWDGCVNFLAQYGYALNTNPTERLIDYIENLRAGKTMIEFIEDFFYEFHLPCLLRRMDFASMAASKEARVPFVSKDLVEYMYRRPHTLKFNAQNSKLPLRTYAEKLGLTGALSRKKIGFSAQLNSINSRQQDYRIFQETILEELKW